MSSVFNYIKGKSPIHALTGASKLLVLVLWSLSAMTTFDTRLLVALPIISLLLFIASGIKYRDVSFVLNFTFVFMVLNNLLIFLFSPEHGVTIYGTRNVLWEGFGIWVVTKEQLFYQLNVVLKYLATIPLVLLFVTTTDPSEFASSLNRIGVSYKISYSVSLALRYIPDIQREYKEISVAHQARGLELDKKKESLFKILKCAATLLFPLIVSSMERIEIVAAAMELRGFGKNRKRTWYSSRPFRKGDWIAILFSILLLALSIALNFINGGRYYNPFV